MSTGDVLADRLVAAGVDTLLDDPTRVLDRGLRSEDVINRAESSPASFFRKFTTKVDFLSAVLHELSQVRRCDPENVHTEFARQLTASANAVRPAVKAFVDARFGSLTDPSDVRRYILAQGFSSPNSQSSHELRADYQRRDVAVLAAFEALTEGLGANLRAPFSPRSFAIVVTALLDGFALRSLTDADAVSADLITEAVLGFVGAAVVTSGKHEHLDDVLAALAQAQPQRPVPRDLRGAMIAAAKSEFGKRGYFATNLDAIADVAGVPLDRARKLFPTKPHVVVGALRRHVEALAEAVADDVLVDLDEVTIIRNHLLRCAQLVADETVFMDALLVAVAFDTLAEPHGILAVKEELNIPAIIAPIVAQAQENGTFVSTESPFEVAAGIMNTLFIRCFTRRDHSPEANAGLVGDLLLRGLVVAPDPA